MSLPLCQFGHTLKKRLKNMKLFLAKTLIISVKQRSSLHDLEHDYSIGDTVRY